MPFEKMGLGAVLGLDARQAVRSSQKARDEFGRFIKTARGGPAVFGKFGLSMDSMAARARRASTGIRQIGGAVRSLTMAMAPMSIAMGLGIKTAMNFEQQMAGVSSITRMSAKDQEEHAENMGLLTQKAKEMGITSVFSATQAGEAMEYMGRAGFSTTEIIGGLEGVMSAAAAEGIDLATTTDIVAGTIRGFGLAATDAGRVADVLAMTSARTNTSMISLREGLSYVADTAKGLGVSLEETSAVLGLLADAGVKGSRSGTVLKNVLVRLAAPTGAATKAMKRLGLNVKDANNNFIGMPSILEQLRTGLNKQGGAIDRVAVASKLFGMRGGAITSLLGRLDKATAGNALTFSELVEQLENASGAAKRMADIRLATLSGAFTLLGSSVAAAGIEVFSELLKPAADFVRDFTYELNAALLVFMAMSGTTEEADKAMEKYGPRATAIAKGVRQAVNAINYAFETGVAWIMLFGKKFESAVGTPNLEKLTRIGTLLTVGAGAAGPLLAVLAGIGFVIPAIGTALAGLGTVLAAVFWPAVVAVGAVYLAYSLLRQENESLFDTAKRVWGGVKTWAIDAWQNGILPFWFGFKNLILPVVDELAAVWRSTMTELKGIWGDTIGAFTDGTSDFEVNWRSVGGTVASVVGAIAVTVAELTAGVVGFFGDMVKGAKLLYRGYQLVTDAIVETMLAVGTTFIDTLLTPIQLVVSQIVTLARVIPGIDAPPWMEAFAEKGFRGLIPPRLPPKEEEPGVLALEPAPGRRGKKVITAAAAVEVARVEAIHGAEGERTLTASIESKLSIDGREATIATAEHKRTLLERSGAKTTPWQRQMAFEQGLV